ncbi:MAG: TVP38/TMEM64 family protein [Candidatus Rokuibacteriota bacterium]|nr:MAG: TVP38/TMEM64 family protein [Candidatus Rokubacteria bacterium]
MTRQSRWLWGSFAGASLAVVVGVSLWVGLAGTPAVRFLIRLYVDQLFLKAELETWGVWAPLVFIGIQALQVVIAPIPGEVTGFLGGFVFGQWVGLAYSMVGLSLGSFLAFAVGRWLGTAFVQRLVSPEVWQRLGFIVEAEGAILCFVLYLIPGFPKDLLCYLFGLSPMPFWVFALTSTAGRLPGTWVLSAQGADTAAGHYLEIALLMALVAAVALPLYHYRHLLIERVYRRPRPRPRAPGR